MRLHSFCMWGCRSTRRVCQYGGLGMHLLNTLTPTPHEKRLGTTSDLLQPFQKRWSRTVCTVHRLCDVGRDAGCRTRMRPQEVIGRTKNLGTLAREGSVRAAGFVRQARRKSIFLVHGGAGTHPDSSSPSCCVYNRLAVRRNAFARRRMSTSSCKYLNRRSDVTIGRVPSGQRLWRVFLTKIHSVPNEIVVTMGL